MIDYYKDCDPGRVYWLESASAFRDAFAEHNPAFALIRDVDDAFEHVITMLEG